MSFTLNAPGSNNNPYTNANLVIPRGTIQSDTTGWKLGSGTIPVVAHDTAFGSTITSRVTVAAILGSDFVFVGSVVRTGANAGAFVGVYYNGSTEMRICRINAAGTKTDISNALTITALSANDTITCVYNTGTGAVTAQINGGSNLSFTGTTTDSTYAAESTLAAGFGFDAQNSNGTKVSSFFADGQAATAYSITADESTFTLAAQDAGLTATRTITADQSTFALGAQAATLTWSWGEYFTVTPADANTTSGQSIFGGLTINSGSLVILPNLIGGIVATWETSNGNATGRVTLASALADPVAVSIPYYDGSTWSTIDVTFIDQGDVTITITSDHTTFALSAQDANLVATRVITADQSAFALTVQDATLGITSYSVDAAYSLFALSVQNATLLYSGEPAYIPDSTYTNQGNQQGAFRALALTTETYNGDFIAAMRADLADDTGSINELMIKWLQQKLGSSNQSLPGLMAEAANDRGVSRWQEITNPLAIGT